MDECWVRLQRLRDGLVFPAEFQERISYDSERKRLVFRGFMSKADFDRLTRLHDDFHYQRAIYQLFVAAGSTDSWPPWFWIIVGVVLCALLSAVWLLTR